MPISPEDIKAAFKTLTATAFEEGKVYLIEYDVSRIDDSTLDFMSNMLVRGFGVKAIFVGTLDGKAIRAVELERPVKQEV